MPVASLFVFPAVLNLSQRDGKKISTTAENGRVKDNGDLCRTGWTEAVGLERVSGHAQDDPTHTRHGEGGGQWRAELR